MNTRDEQQSGQPSRRILAARTIARLLLALAVLIAAFLFVNSAFFTVGEVVVAGNNHISVEDIHSIAGIPSEVNIFRLNTGEINKRLLRDLRIASAEVTRRFPATIAISVTERQPLAWLACSYGFVQVDKQGMVMTAVKSIKKIDVPLITGIRLGTIYVGDKVDLPAAGAVLSYLADLDEATLAQLAEINIRPNGDLAAYTVQSVNIRIGPPERLPEKAKFTHDILLEIGGKKAPIEYIDLNYASPYIKFKQIQRKE